MVRAIVGANWGDEGKGKLTDMLAEKSDIVVRFQGGANAGHTIVNHYGSSLCTLCLPAYSMITQQILSATVLHLISLYFSMSLKR